MGAMDGCAAVYPALAAIFVAQVFGVDLAVTDYLLIAFVSVVGSGAPPGAASSRLPPTRVVPGAPAPPLLSRTLRPRQAASPLEKARAAAMPKKMPEKRGFAIASGILFKNLHR